MAAWHEYPKHQRRNNLMWTLFLIGEIVAFLVILYTQSH
jgi:hypothetical protein